MRETHTSTEERTFTQEFVFPGEKTAMIPARDAIMQFLSGQGVGEEEGIDILVALQEALANAVVHGCGNDPAKTVCCTADVNPLEINIVIRDPGPGFDTSSVNGAGEDGTNFAEQGRGIFLMRSMMDEIKYSHGGSQVHMKKLRSLPGVSPSGAAS